MLWKILTIVGGLLMFASFFVPWWGVSVRPIEFTAADTAEVRRANADEGRQARQIRSDNDVFYSMTMSRAAKNRLVDAVNSSAPASEAANANILRYSDRIFGWNTATGIISFIFGILVIVLAVLALSVRFLRRWDWPLMLGAMGLSIPVLILALVFWLASPGEATDRILHQGVSVGPFLALPGAIISTVASAIAGIVGLVVFLRRVVRIHHEREAMGHPGSPAAQP